MTKLIFSGTDKKFFDALTFGNIIDAKWLFIDELVNTEYNVKNTKFVLLYSAPEAFLISDDNDADTTLESIEQQWQPQIEQLTQFYLGNIEHTLLVDQEQCKTCITEFITLLENKLGLEKGACQADKNVNYFALNEQVSNQVKQLGIINSLKDSYSVQDSYENIVSAADLLTPDYDTSIEQRQVDCFNNYQQTLKAIQTLSLSNDKLAEEKQQLSKAKATLEHNLQQSNEECKLTTLQVDQQQKELESSVIKNKELTEQVHVQQSELKSCESEAKKKADELAGLKAENELSLLQMQQLQEELEASFLNNKELTEQMDVQKSALKGAESATKQKADELAGLKAENELSLLQIQQLQEELEASFLNNKELTEQVNVQKSALKSAESATKQKAEELDGLKAENELSLLQIQQLQEELEFYFIKYQSLSSNPFINNKTAMNIVDKRFEKSLNLAKLLTA